MVSNRVKILIKAYNEKVKQHKEWKAIRDYLQKKGKKINVNSLYKDTSINIHKLRKELFDIKRQIKEDKDNFKEN